MRLFFFFTLFIMLLGCNSTPSPVTISPVNGETQVMLQSAIDNHEVIQEFDLDNCDGKADATRTEHRSSSVDVTISSELAAKIGASAQVISADVQAAVGTALSIGGERGTSIEVKAPPNTHMFFQLAWVGKSRIGVVQNVSGSNIPVAFQSFTPDNVRIKSQYDIGCRTTPAGSPTTVASPLETTPAVTQVLPQSPNSIPEHVVNQLNMGQVSVDDVMKCLDTAHAGARPFVSFKANDQIPSNALIATDYGGGGKTWNEFPVTPVCYSGSWGLFKSNASYIAPYEGAYWVIVR
jgi:hypothetical protein